MIPHSITHPFRIFCKFQFWFYSIALSFLFLPYFFSTYFQPLLVSGCRIHDTCGVHNLHGMPAVISAIFSAIYASLASSDNYKDSLYDVFPAMNWKNSSYAYEHNSTIIVGVNIQNYAINCEMVFFSLTILFIIICSVGLWTHSRWTGWISIDWCCIDDCVCSHHWLPNRSIYEYATNAEFSQGWATWRWNLLGSTGRLQNRVKFKEALVLRFLIEINKFPRQ